jgi:hypothetical protein
MEGRNMADRLIKGQTRAEVFVILPDGKRHWIPDPPTLTSRWAWSDVQVIPQEQVYLFVLGDPIPSVVSGQTWADGALVVAPPAPEVYVVRGGQRHWIPNPATFVADGFDWGDVEAIDEARLTLIPQGAPLAPTGTYTFDSGDQFLGSGHYMHTWGAITLGTGALAAQTRTRTVTWFGGYHGGVYLIAADANDAPVWQSQNHRYGVDGTAVGTSDRTDSWWESIPVDHLGSISRLYIFQQWEPDSFMTILGKWVAASKPVGDLVIEAAAVAKVVAAAFA